MWKVDKQAIKKPKSIIQNSGKADQIQKLNFWTSSVQKVPKTPQAVCPDLLRVRSLRREGSSHLKWHLIHLGSPNQFSDEQIIQRANA